jgi:hypothetical protein
MPNKILQKVREIPSPSVRWMGWPMPVIPAIQEITERRSLV